MVVAAWGTGSWADHSNKNEAHEATLLSLDISKAKSYLKWHPIWDVEEALKKTIDWYKKYRQGNMYRACREQITSWAKDQKSLF